MRRNPFHLFLDRVRDLQPVDELMDLFAPDIALAAGEILERFVGLVVPFAAQDILDGFGYDHPIPFKVLPQCFFVEHQFGQAFQDRLKSDQSVGCRHADIAHDG